MNMKRKKGKTMDDLIRRQQAINALSTITMYKGSIPFDTAVMRIEQLPSAQPELKKGKWIRNGWAITCSECGYDMPYTVRNYCPNCGADMRGEQDG